MRALFWLSKSHLALIEPYFPLSGGAPRVDDRRVTSGMIHVIRRGLQWCDASLEYGPCKTLYNRFVRWSQKGVFDRIFQALSREAACSGIFMIDSTCLKIHRTAASLLKKGMFPAISDEREGPGLEIARGV